MLLFLQALFQIVFHKNNLHLCVNTYTLIHQLIHQYGTTPIFWLLEIMCPHIDTPMRNDSDFLAFRNYVPAHRYVNLERVSV